MQGAARTFDVVIDTVKRTEIGNRNQMLVFPSCLQEMFSEILLKRFKGVTNRRFGSLLQANFALSKTHHRPQNIFVIHCLSLDRNMKF